MNRVIIMGRLTADPDVRYTNGANGQLCIARYTLAVNRRGKDKEADFIRCIAFGKSGEFSEKYMKKGGQFLIEGHIQTGSYDDKDGKKVYTTDVVVDSQEFTESKGKAADGPYTQPKKDSEGFMSVPDSVDDDFLPFN